MIAFLLWNVWCLKRSVSAVVSQQGDQGGPLERIVAGEALIQNDADAPQVAPCVVRLVQNDFRCHVQRRANN